MPFFTGSYKTAHGSCAHCDGSRGPYGYNGPVYTPRRKSGDFGLSGSNNKIKQTSDQPGDHESRLLSRFLGVIRARSVKWLHHGKDESTEATLKFGSSLVELGARAIMKRTS